MQYEEIRRQVLGAIREAQARGLIHGTSGNIAVRQPGGDVVAITPSGRPYDTMQPEDIAIVTLSGEWIDGPYRPSSETPMHTAVYRARPDVGATVHTHALYSTVMAMGLDELPPSTPPQAEFAPMRVVPFAVPGSQKLADYVTVALGADGLAVLLRNHGNFCCGRDISAAMTAAVYVEEAAQVAYHATLLGQFRPLAAEDVQACKDMLAAGRAV
ncbi:class II aldolase/adducin family protein [uncultured Flavonifractor sp.]|uniref:class II aldolase/adducin family protein n=1 Tax=uncultured Flavonifractor sp. TaxID=1193534 RepID=UPI0017485D22|nr:class II aldolase/adducin family protein [uncultured Flavonifractor sp.]